MKKSNREIIESANPKYENSYMKFTKGKLIDVSGEKTSVAVKPNKDKIEKEFKRKIKSGGFKASNAYFSIHTHPAGIGQALPSPQDIKVMMKYHVPKIKREGSDGPKRHVEVIAARDASGKLSGYTMIFQRKNPHRKSDKKELEKIAQEEKQYIKEKESSKEESSILIPASPGKSEVSIGSSSISIVPQKIRYKRLEGDLIKSGFDIKFYPARGYHLNKINFRYEPNKHSLEKTVSVILLGAIFLLMLFKIHITGAIISPKIYFKYDFSFLLIMGLLISSLIYFARRHHKNIKQ